MVIGGFELDGLDGSMVQKDMAPLYPSFSFEDSLFVGLGTEKGLRENERGLYLCVW